MISNQTINKIFFDVGANNGNTSVPYAQNDSNIKVYAFEPTPEMIKQIENRTQSINNYFLTKKAVSNYNGKATFKVSEQGDWGCSSLLEFSDKSKTEWCGRPEYKVNYEMQVEVIRLDSFIKEHNIPKIDYLHIDTQGSDLKVLEGLGEYINIVEEGVMEAAAKENILYYGQNSQQESIEFLKKNGFEITSIEYNEYYNNEVNIFFKRKV
jgi:FkbM family methyltransferase